MAPMRNTAKLLNALELFKTSVKNTYFWHTNFAYHVESKSN